MAKRRFMVKMVRDIYNYKKGKDNRMIRDFNVVEGSAILEVDDSPTLEVSSFVPNIHGNTYHGPWRIVDCLGELDEIPRKVPILKPKSENVKNVKKEKGKRKTARKARKANSR